jgi:hypothetical protein
MYECVYVYVCIYVNMYVCIYLCMYERSVRGIKSPDWILEEKG